MYQRKSCHVTLAVICALVCIGSVARAEAFIVKDGKAVAEIVVGEKTTRTTKLAAEELQSLVGKISGAELPIVREPGGARVKIYVGRSARTDALGIALEGLSDDAYRVETGENWLALIGPDREYTPREPYARIHSDRPRAQKEWDNMTGGRWRCPGQSGFKGFNKRLGIWVHDGHGSLNAVYDFLRSLGARWYFPGEFGECLPQMKTIPLPKVSKTVRPDFAIRNIAFSGHRFFAASRERALWYLRLGLSWDRTSVGSHGIDFVIHHDNPRKNHLDWYRLTNGKRDTVSRGGKPCLSAPGLARANIEFAQKYFDVYGAASCSVMPTDGYVSLCQCDLCRDKDTPERGYRGQLSDYVWSYVDKVARGAYKTHPDKKIVCGAYSAYKLPPKKIDRLSPNVRVMISQNRYRFHDPVVRREALELRKAWLLKLSGDRPLSLHDNYSHWRGALKGIPVYYPRIIAEDIRSLKGICEGEHIEAIEEKGRQVPPPNMAFNHLNVYVTARMWWDADQDVETMLSEYYEKFYGPAAKEMKAFIEFCEANWFRMLKEAPPIDKAVALMAAARGAAGAEGIHADRLALIDGFMEPLRQLREKVGMGRKNVPNVRFVERRGKRKIRIDGKLDDEFWQDLPKHRLREIQTGRPPSLGTWFHVAWRNDNLYFGVYCQERKGEALNIGTRRNEDPNLWNGDAVEFLIETQNHAYYQIAVNPAGAIIDLDRVRKIDTLWDSQAEVASHIGEDYWSLEIRIPIADEAQEENLPRQLVSGRKPNKVQPWYFNVGRVRKRKTGVEASMFSPTGKRHFHVPEKFGRLYLK